MKKLFIISILLLQFSMIYPISSNVTFGVQDKTTNIYEHNNLFVSLNIWEDFSCISIYGKYVNEMSYDNDIMRFIPSLDYYTIGVGCDIGFISVKLEHMCYHPVVPWGKSNGINGGYTKFEITIGD